jgi:hypothetical protein
MFAGSKAFAPNDLVTLGDVVIPIFEYEWHNGGHRFFNFLWDEYTWNAAVFPGMDRELDRPETDGVSVASGGMGAAVNCMLPLVNVYDDHVQMSNAGVKSDSPGVGSFTPYHGRIFRATVSIEPGTELFADYGENYFWNRNDTYGYLPLFNNFEEANILLKEFQNVTATANHDTQITSDLYHLLKHFESVWDESRTLHALPDNETQVQAILDSGGTARKDYNRSIRDLDFLEDHGSCMDNIKDGISTVPHAGRGAFANRKIKKGETFYYFVRLFGFEKLIERDIHIGFTTTAIRFFGRPGTFDSHSQPWRIYHVRGSERSKGSDPPQLVFADSPQPTSLELLLWSLGISFTVVSVWSLDSVNKPHQG